LLYVLGWPGPYICTVYDRMYGDFLAKNSVCTPYIPINVWFWPTLFMLTLSDQRRRSFLGAFEAPTLCKVIKKRARDGENLVSRRRLLQCTKQQSYTCPYKLPLLTLRVCLHQAVIIKLREEASMREGLASAIKGKNKKVCLEGGRF